MSDIVERLRDYAAINEMDYTRLPSESKVLRDAADEIEQLRKERDEARELYCLERSYHSVCLRSVTDAKTIARNRGWEDLFKEGGGA